METNFQGLNRRKVLSHLTAVHVVFQIVAIVILGIFWGVICQFVWIENDTAERNAIDNVRELTDIYESHMVRNLGFIDQTLKTLKYAYEQRPTPAVLADLEKKEMLPPKLVFTVSIADRFGEIVASSALRKQPSIGHQPFFHLHSRDDTTTSNINLIKDLSQGWKIRFSRRLNTPSGAFNGVVMLSVDPEYFTSDYDKSRLGDQGVIGLVGVNGVFWVKRTGEQVVVGEPAFKTEIDLSVIEEEKDSWPELYFVDGIKRYANAKRLYGHPLGIVVGVSQDEQLASSQEKINTYYWIAGIISVLFAGISVVIARLLLQLNQSRMRSRKNQETHYAALEASSDGIYVLRAVLDQDGNATDFVIDDLNNRGALMFGRSKKDLVGSRFSETSSDIQENGLLDLLIDAYKTGAKHESEWKKNIPTLNIEWLQREFVRVEDGVVAVVRDITDRKRSEERITHMAHHDALTGLPNRSLLNDRLQQAMLRAKRESRRVTLAFLDLDNFKPINDTLGHRVGDELLKTVSERMLKCVRQTDTVIRFGGDEFLIILGDQLPHYKVLPPTLQRIRTAVSEPVYFEGNRLQVTVSMGVAQYPEDGDNLETLVLNADTAMYAAKSKGGDNYQYYAPGMKMCEDAVSVADGIEVSPQAQEKLR